MEKRELKVKEKKKGKHLLYRFSVKGENDTYELFLDINCKWFLAPYRSEAIVKAKFRTKEQSALCLPELLNINLFSSYTEIKTP